jgi:hypothetical protein
MRTVGVRARELAGRPGGWLAASAAQKETGETMRQIFLVTAVLLCSCNKTPPLKIEAPSVPRFESVSPKEKFQSPITVKKFYEETGCPEGYVFVEIQRKSEITHFDRSKWNRVSFGTVCMDAAFADSLMSTSVESSYDAPVDHRDHNW